MALYKTKIEIETEKEADKIKSMSVAVAALMKRQHAEYVKEKKEYDCADLIAGIKFDVSVYVKSNIITWEAKNHVYQWQYIPRQGDTPSNLIAIPPP
jgi:hypothetical protein